MSAKYCVIFSLGSLCTSCQKENHGINIGNTWEKHGKHVGDTREKHGIYVGPHSWKNVTVHSVLGF
jgi:hypothetical protein